MWFVGEISNRLPKGLFGTKVYKTLESCWWCVSGVKSSRLYPSLILNITLFSILFTYICTDGLSVFSPCFFKMYSK